MRERGRLIDRRIRLLLAVLVLLLLASLGRAVWLQGVRAGPLERLALNQHRITVDIPARRGTLYDRTGSELALGEHAVTVYANPRQIRDPQRVALVVSRTLEMDEGEAFRRLSDRAKGFVYLARQADPDKADALKREKIEGLGFLAEERRAYPQGSLAAHVVGFAGTDNRGLAGLEKSLDGALSGRAGQQTLVRDPVGRAIDVVDTTPERDGLDVRLTLDHNIQATAEEVLRSTVRRWRARSGTAIVLDPRDGAVLAMAVAPGFDANRFGALSPALTKNRAVTDVYEPGSTFKVVTVAGVLGDGLAEPDTAYTLPYSIRVADRTIHDSHGRATEVMTVREILAKSSNVGTVTLAELMGRTRLARWIERFGFGRRTGIDFPGEEEGLVLRPHDWSGSTIGNIPIGQGIGVTPLQMAAAYAAVANRGVWVRPRLVERIGLRPPVRPQRRRLLDPGLARTVVGMLQGVVSERGTGFEAAIPGYSVAGKTGTAEKPGPNGYGTGKYVASFVGFVPATSPRLVVAVMVDEPREMIWGGVVAAPAFAQIARFGLQYLEVPPDARR